MKMLELLSNRFSNLYKQMVNSERISGTEDINKGCIGVNIENTEGSRSKCAFTLTEVLIALTVVGLVSALVVPSLYNRFNEKSMTRLRAKTKLAVLNTLDMYLTEEGKSKLTATEMRNSAGVHNYLMSYYRVNTDCNENSTTCFADNYTGNDGTIMDYPNVNDGDNNISCIKSNNSAVICMSPIDNETQEGDILIDVNATKGPNIEGKDVLRLTYANDGNLGGDDELVATEYILTVMKDDNVTAVNPSLSSLVEGGRKTIVATFETGYELNAWSKESGSCTVTNGGVVTMGNSDCRVRVTSKKIKYAISVNKGSCQSAGDTKTVEYGETINVWANPETDGTFNSWNGCGQSSSSKNFSFQTTQACTITASCTSASKYNLTVIAGTGISSVSANPSSNLTKSQSSTVSYNYQTGYENASLTKTSGGCTVSGNTVTNFTSDCTVKVSATAKNYTLTVQSGTCASATGGGSVSYGGTKTISATPKSNSQNSGNFTGWTKNSGSCTISGNTVTMGDGNCTYTANCSEPTAEKYTLTVNKGTCASATGGGSYSSGATASVSATKPTDSSDKTYSGPTFRASGCSISGSTVTMGSSNCTVTADCPSTAIKKYTVTVNKGTCDSVTGGGTVEAGKTVSASVTAAEGSAFTGWSGCGQSGTNTSISFTPTSSCALTASCSAAYTPKDYNIYVSENSIIYYSGYGSTEISSRFVTTDSPLNVDVNNCGTFSSYVKNPGQEDSFATSLCLGNNGSIEEIDFESQDGYEITRNHMSWETWKVNIGSEIFNGNGGYHVLDNRVFTLNNGDKYTIIRSYNDFHSINLSAGPGGIVTPSSISGLVRGETRTINAFNKADYKFNKWISSNDSCFILDDTSSTTSVIMGDSDCQITATFKKI